MHARKTSKTLGNVFLLTALVLGALAFISAGKVLAEERQFLVVPATSPKQFGNNGGVPADGLENPEAIRQQYFGDNGLGSYAEYWEEISYGDVTINGDSTDWVNLPWPVSMPGYLMNAMGIGVDNDQEMFLNSVRADKEAHHWRNMDDYGRPEEFSGSHCTEDREDAFTGECLFNDVYKPGERFLDVNGNGMFDGGIDEGANVVDSDEDNIPDGRGPWIDLNRDGDPVNANQNCVYLDNQDNDSFPDCCPEGDCFLYSCPPTQWADYMDCNGNYVPDICDVSDPRNGTTPEQLAECRALINELQQEGFDMMWLTDELMGTSHDMFPIDADTGFESEGDGIPDECQFIPVQQAAMDAAEAGDESIYANFIQCGSDACDQIQGQQVPNRCEYADDNNSNSCTVVEPFENYMRRLGTIGDIELTPVDWPIIDEGYIRANYPAREADVEALIAESFDSRILFGTHGGPGTCEGKFRFVSINTGFNCDADCPAGRDGDECRLMTCGLPEDYLFPCEDQDEADEALEKIENDEEPACNPAIIVAYYCVAGFHQNYDPPDSWDEGTPSRAASNAGAIPGLPERAGDGDREEYTRSSKMVVPSAFISGVSTPEPDWYDAFWRDRYGDNATPPAWNPVIPAAAELSDPTFGYNTIVDETIGTYARAGRMVFRASAGGINGDGTGWPRESNNCGGTGNIDFSDDPALGVRQGFVGFGGVCNPARMPHEFRNGPAGPPDYYDGWVEFDDLASSKYHRAGDRRLGEVTSPLLDSFDIFGEDIGTGVPGGLALSDTVIAAAGPYATDVHGNGNFDGGNLLNLELLTWGNAPNCTAWNDELTFDGTTRSHPYTSFGFADYNLDGMIDLGWTRAQRTENYILGAPLVGIPSYPFNRTRLVEDAIEVIDRLLDFDDFVDINALEAINCVSGTLASDVPSALAGDDTPSSIQPDGVVSGIVILPNLDGTYGAIGVESGELPPHRAWWLGDGGINFRPIHTNDNDNPSKALGGNGEIGWNLFFHDFVHAIGDRAYLNKPDAVDCDGLLQTNTAAYAYLQAWEGMPTLYDPDVLTNPAQANSPMGLWDQMADGCLNHMQPILKESPCTEWIDPIDLRTVLRPGVPATITIPPYENVRDRNAYFLENPNSLGERFYFYSVGEGFDGDMPGEGLLLVHTDVGANPESLPNGQQNATRFAYVVEQADGLDELGAPFSSPDSNFGDAGDVFPGATAKRNFNLSSTPSAVWYAQESWTGIDISDVRADGQGSVAVTLSWTPTSIPSLRFIDPPGGSSTDGNYQIRVEATDVHGGTTIELYSTRASEFTSVDDSTNNVQLVGTIEKVNPGTRLLTFDWDVSSMEDGAYFLFAKLIPDRGADGQLEREFSEPIPGRNNRGSGSLTVQEVNIDRDKARLETWTMRLVDVLPDGTQDWIVFGSLSQPEPDEFAADQDPYPHLFVDPLDNYKGQYTSIDEEVTFTLEYRIPASESAVGDTWTFVSTGITAVSSAVTVLNGEIDEAPRAIVNAVPQSPRPGEPVRFDALSSSDPNGEQLDYTWDFGDGSIQAFGPVVTHTFTRPGQFTVTLKATNVNSDLFDEDRLEIIVFNNRPNADFDAFPTSGSRPLTVQFDASDSGDQESGLSELIFEWDFGDGAKANVAKSPGTFVSTEHVYIADREGKLCTPDAPCRFEAKLTLTDLAGEPGFKTHTHTEVIWVGNTTPDPQITASALSGSDPLTVRFNASGSIDPDNQDLKVTWEWGDGSADEEFDATNGEDGNGNVMHTFTRRDGETTSQFTVTAILSDGVATAEETFRVTVREPTLSSSNPVAAFEVKPANPEVGVEFEADASSSFDRPNGFPTSYEWNWGDGSATSTGVIAKHTYDEPGIYSITLTVKDGEDPPNEDMLVRTVDLRGGDDNDDDGTGNARPVAELSVSPLEGFAGFTEFTFDASESTDSDSESLSYSWSFGDGSPRDDREVATHIFAEPGEYRVSLTVRDSANASDDAFVNITVLDNSDNRNPVPRIGTGPRTGTAPLTLTFDGQLSFDPDGDTLEYRWEFIRDGALVDSSNGNVVTQLFSEAGSYSVVLEVSDGRGGIARTEPELISVAARADDPGSENPVPDNPDDDDDDAPAPICGLGATAATFGSMLGLMMLRLAGTGRRRRRMI